jgi:hypothetical protein
MSETQETNELLREIRDLMAKREELYQQYLLDSRKLYAEQAQLGAAERKKSMREVTILLVLLAVIIVVVLKF